MNELKKRWSTLSKKEKNIVIGIIVGILILISSGIAFALTYKSDQVDKKDSKVEPVTDKIDLNRVFPVDEEETEIKEVSPFSGNKCERYNARPIAVMMAGDEIARPLSGLSKAEFVVEMPVITGSVTRLMGIFVCDTPDEVGSIRSSRHDYISLVRGWDTIFVHWGGSHFALDEIKTGIRYTGENLGKVDSIDALTTSGPFFRQNFVAAPHNGFASLPKVIESAKQKGYNMEGKFEGYKFQSDRMTDQEKENSVDGVLEVGFGGVFKTKWEYSSDKNKYIRYWNNEKDSDRINNEEIKASNIVVMRAFSEQIEGQYNSVNIYGEGEAKIFQNGKEINAKWKKDGFKGALKFFDMENNEIRLVKGQTFIEIIEPYQSLIWNTK